MSFETIFISLPIAAATTVIGFGGPIMLAGLPSIIALGAQT